MECVKWKKELRTHQRVSRLPACRSDWAQERNARGKWLTMKLHWMSGCNAIRFDEELIRSLINDNDKIYWNDVIFNRPFPCTSLAMHVEHVDRWVYYFRRLLAIFHGHLTAFWWTYAILAMQHVHNFTPRSFPYRLFNAAQIFANTSRPSIVRIQYLNI